MTSNSISRGCQRMAIAGAACRAIRWLMTALPLILASPAGAVIFTSNTSLGVGDTMYDGQSILVSNCTLTVNGPHTFASLVLTSNAVLTHASAPNGETNNRVLLTIIGDAAVDASSSINASARGYASASGPGAGGTWGDYGSGGGRGLRSGLPARARRGPPAPAVDDGAA